MSIEHYPGFLIIYSPRLTNVIKTIVSDPQREILFLECFIVNDRQNKRKQFANFKIKLGETKMVTLFR